MCIRNHNLINILLLFILIMIVEFNSAFAIEYSSINRYNITAWDTDDGLPTIVINDINQSNDGYLWLTSYHGIIRFDGFEFEVFDKKEIPELKTNTFYEVSKDKNGNLWFSSLENGLIRYNNKDLTFYSKDSIKSDSFEGAYVDDLLRYWSLDIDEREVNFSRNQIKFPKLDTSFNNIQINYVTEHEGKYVFATSKGLFFYKDGNLEIYNKKNGLASEFVNFVYFKNKKIVLATINGLYNFDGDKFILDKSIGEIEIKKIVSDNKNNLFIATKDGLYYKDANSSISEKMTVEDGLTSNFISDIFIDFENNIWVIPAKGGLIKLQKDKFLKINDKSGLAGRVVNALFEIEPNVVLAGFDNGKLNQINGIEILNYGLDKEINGVRIRHIYKDSRKNLWVSTYNGLLKVQDNGETNWYRANDQFPSSLVRLVFEDSKGNIWIGTREAGVIKLEPSGEIKLINYTSGLSHNLIMDIAETIEGDILVSTSAGGINIIRDEEVIGHYNLENGMSTNMVFKTYIDKLGNIWCATNAGINRIYEDSVFVINEKIGLPSDNLYNIVEDRNGTFWIPHSEGLLRVTRDEIIQKSIDNDYDWNYSEYDKYDGLPKAGFTAVSQSLVDASGNIWLSTMNGLVKIDPFSLEPNKLPPLIHIKKIFIDKEEIEVNDYIKIKPGMKRVKINYAGISYSSKKKINYRYMLSGFDEKWNYVNSSERSVTYTNLNPGYYTFVISASNNDGFWNPVNKEIKLEIEPFWYETTLFRLFAILLIAILFYFAFRLRVNKLKARQRELEELVSKRTKEVQEQNIELREANATKDKFFSIIAHDLKNPIGSFRMTTDMLNDYFDKLNDHEKKNILRMLDESANNLVELLENLLEWSRSQRGVIKFQANNIIFHNLVEEVFKFQRIYAEEKHIYLLNKVPANLAIHIDYNLMNTILRNLVSNAIKFTNKYGKIEVGIHDESEDYFTIFVSDTGVGISPQMQDKLFKIDETISTDGTSNEKGTGLGLIICKEFVELHGGQIWVKSKLGEGTKFFFTISKKISEEVS